MVLALPGWALWGVGSGQPTMKLYQKSSKYKASETRLKYLHPTGKEVVEGERGNPFCPLLYSNY